MPLALFCVGTLENEICHVSRISILSVHMWRLLWLKTWSAKPACRRHLLHMPFDGKCQFGESLNTFIREVNGGNVLLPHKKYLTPHGVLHLLSKRGSFALPRHPLQNQGLVLPFIISPGPLSLPRLAGSQGVGWLLHQSRSEMSWNSRSNLQADHQ